MYSHWCWFQKQQTDHKVLHMKQGKLPKKMGFQTLSLAVTASFVIFITISLKWDQKVPLSSFYAGYKQYKLPSTFILGNKIEKKPKVLLSLFFSWKIACEPRNDHFLFHPNRKMMMKMVGWIWILMMMIQMIMMWSKI